MPWTYQLPLAPPPDERPPPDDRLPRDDDNEPNEEIESVDDDSSSRGVL